MRKTQKKQAEEFAALLGQAHGEIKKAVEKKNISAALSILADCQEGAISLGNLIEQTEGENAPTIRVLEEYCEQLYHIYQGLAEEEAVNAGKIYKVLRQALIKIENSIQHDITVRLEAVFLPYKASMWDSLESVWRAADAAPDCDAYVIPIPYYDKNPDGSFGQVHYEAGEYPKDVPIVHYAAYDFEKRRPDMIFIHNPYDNQNYVTSVFPFFYSDNLKQFTDLLVYIPYFVLDEIDPDDTEAVKHMAHFCTMPAVLNADKVIVQSENMRKIYIKVMTAFAGEHTRKQWEKKIEGSGSPKVDKILRTKKEELQIPDKWREVIEKPDGNWKKIVFYNTGVTALLQNGSEMLAKIQSVFATFKNYKDEVAFLWRPHPLIRATIESMRPGLWREYKKIAERYQEEKWGIYDDTADIDRAVVLCDIYYGDASSVTTLVKKINKPVLLQTMQTKHNILSNMMEWVVTYEDKLYFSAIEFGGICSFDLKRGVFEVESYIKAEKSCIYRAYGNGKRKNNKLYMTPLMSEKVVIYDLQKNDYDWIELPRMSKEARRHQKTREFVVHDDKIYLLPQTEYYPYIVQIDENTKQTKIFDCSRYCENSAGVFCNTSAEFDNKRFLFCIHNNVYEFLYDTQKINKVRTKSNGKVKDIFINDHEVVILEDEIVVYDRDWNIIDTISLTTCNISENETIKRIYKKEKYIYLYSDHSTFSKQIYRIDLQTGGCISTCIRESESYYISIITDENEIRFAYFVNGKMHVIDEELLITEWEVKTKFDINEYLCSNPDWSQNLNDTYHYLNETEILLNALGRY